MAIGHRSDPATGPDLDPALGELALSISAQFLTEFRQNELAWMNEDDAEHVFL